MKYLIATLLLMSCSAAFAANSSQDPIVASLREKFKAGQPVGIEHLRWARWVCTRYSAVKSDYSVSAPNIGLSFDEMPNGIFTRNDIKDVKIEPNDVLPVNFIQRPEGFLSIVPTTTPNVSIGFVFRANGPSNVIGETSYVYNGSRKLRTDSDYEASLALKNSVVDDYLSCDVIVESQVKVVGFTPGPVQRKKSLWDRIRGR